MAEHRHHIRMGQRGLNDQADACAGQHGEQRREHRDRDQQHEHAIGGIGGVEQAKRHEIELRRHAVVNRQFAPDHLHQLFDDEGEPKGEQKLRDMAAPVQTPQAVALDERPDHADHQRRQDEAGPEADAAADLEAEIGPEHVEARVGEIEHAHHAEDQRKAARHHEKQHAVEHAVQRRECDELQHRSLAVGASARATPRLCVDGGEGTPASPRDFGQGRSILQVVGRMVSFAWTTPTFLQPHPVPSSSNLAPGSSGPKLLMNMS